MLRLSLSGKAKSGKNTTAEMIAAELKLLHSEFIITSFAKKIKETVSNWFPGSSEEYLYGASELREKYIDSEIDCSSSITYRKACIDIGKTGRGFHPDFWVEHIKAEYKRCDKLKCFMIADQRFQNEFDWAKSEGFIMIRVKRTDYHKIDDISEDGQDLIGDELYDHIIENNDSKEALREKVKRLVKSL